MINSASANTSKVSLAQREELAPNAEDALKANHDEAEYEHSLTEQSAHIHSTQQNMMTQRRASKYVKMSLEHDESSHQKPSMHTKSKITIKCVMKMPPMTSLQPPAFYCLMSLIRQQQPQQLQQRQQRQQQQQQQQQQQNDINTAL